MKKAWLMLFLTYLVFTVTAQSKQPQLLTSPVDWRLEQFSLPPEFAPAEKYRGLEELRFAPGWGKRDAHDYFTLVFGVRFDDTKSVSRSDIKDYLLTYFRGLCAYTAKSRKLSNIDTSAISVGIEKKPATGKTIIYDVSLHMYGVFTDGEPITLNMEIKVMENRSRNQVYLLMIASPQPKTDPVWQELYKEQQGFVMPAN